jgi:hypothetical protein
MDNLLTVLLQDIFDLMKMLLGINHVMRIYEFNALDYVFIYRFVLVCNLTPCWLVLSISCLYMSMGDHYYSAAQTNSVV